MSCLREARRIEALAPRPARSSPQAIGFELVIRRCWSTSSRCCPAPGSARPADLQARRPAVAAARWACAPTPRRRSRASTRTCSIARASRACATAARCCTPGRPAPRHARAAAVRRRDLRPRRPRGRPRGPATLALDVPARGGPQSACIDLADARIVRAVLAGAAAGGALDADPSPRWRPRTLPALDGMRRTLARGRRARRCCALLALVRRRPTSLDEARGACRRRSRHRRGARRAGAAWRALRHRTSQVELRPRRPARLCAIYSGVASPSMRARVGDALAARRPLRRGRRGRSAATGRRSASAST